MCYLPRIISSLNGQVEPRNLARSVFSSIVTTPPQRLGALLEILHVCGRASSLCSCIHNSPAPPARRVPAHDTTNGRAPPHRPPQAPRPTSISASTCTSCCYRSQFSRCRRPQDLLPVAATSLILAALGNFKRISSRGSSLEGSLPVSSNNVDVCFTPRVACPA
jgi:hypothetical protein